MPGKKKMPRYQRGIDEASVEDHSSYILADAGDGITPARKALGLAALTGCLWFPALVQALAGA